MQLMQPKDPAQQQNNIVLKILPVMIGWFALNVPAALTIYWVVNNIVTTATTLAIRNSMDMTPVTTGGSSAASSVDASTIFAHPREKPAGFGSYEPPAPVADASGVKPITGNIVDAVVEEDDGDDDFEEDVVDSGTGMQDDSGSKKVSRLM